MTKGAIANLLITTLLGLLLAGCKGAQFTPTITIEITVTPSATIPSPTPSATPTPQPTPTPTQTPVPTPEGAGLQALDFDFVLDTPLYNIEPGEYLIVWDLNAWEREGVSIHRYISWDGRHQGVLYHLEPHRPNKKGGGFAVTNGRIWNDVGPPSGLFVVDLPSLETSQFSFGRTCDDYLRLDYIGTNYLAFVCWLENSDDTDLFIVSLEDWSITGSNRLSSDLYFSGWIGDNRAEVLSRFDSNSGGSKYCTMEAHDWDIECKEIPYQLGTTSSDGQWVWLRYPLAILPKNCVLADNEECQPTPVKPPSVWEDDISAIATYQTWSPDSKKLISLDVDCRWGSDAYSWVWYYDVSNAQSVALAKLDDCYSFSYSFSADKATWSQDGQRFILEAGYPYYRPTVITLDGTIYHLPIKGLVIGSITLP